MEVDTILASGRVIERLLVAGGGILLIFLGYSLFRLGIFNSQNISMGIADVDVKFHQAAPGTVFSGIGMVLLAIALGAPLELPKSLELPKETPEKAGGPGEAPIRRYLLSVSEKDAANVVRSLNTAIEVITSRNVNEVPQYEWDDLVRAKPYLALVRDEVRLMHIDPADMKFWNEKVKPDPANRQANLSKEEQLKAKEIERWFGDVTEIER